MTFADFLADLAGLLGRRPTYGEISRARNAYSYRLPAAALAALILSGRQH